jgi:transposase-like protein
MTQLSLDGHYGRTIGLDLCHACGGLWFDADESLALTPGATLRLVVVIGEHGQERRAPLGTPTCPRCRATLALTSDMQRNTRFSYWRCAAEHGRFITFAEFLREKSFVRPLSGQELAELRASVKMIRCSSCGAPFDLAQASACGHCRAPVSVLDAHQVERVVAQLKQAETARQTVDPTLPMRLMADRLRVEHLFANLDGCSSASNALGLIETGLATLAELLTNGG